MAKPLEFKPTPIATEPDAHAELDGLIEALHAHGVLRTATALVNANAQWLPIVAEGLNSEGSRKALQNLAALLMALSRIEPAQFSRVLAALGDGVQSAAAHDHANANATAPGLKGAYGMLKDDDLWRGLAPLADALKAFGKGLDRRN